MSVLCIACFSLMRAYLRAKESERYNALMIVFFFSEWFCQEVDSMGSGATEGKRTAMDSGSRKAKDGSRKAKDGSGSRQFDQRGAG